MFRKLWQRSGLLFAQVFKFLRVKIEILIFEKMKNQILLFMFVFTVVISLKTSAQNLSDEEEKGIQLMREEEKLARDVYSFLYEKWQLPIFDNIANSENRHFGAMGYLVNTFDMNDPSHSEEGMFTSLELEYLYDSLTLAGSNSLLTALEVGAFIEEVDIEDLQNLLKNTANKEIILVYENLLRGSRNHLRAFNRQLENRGQDYKPVVLLPHNFNSIVNSSNETGNGNGPCIQTSENLDRPKRNGNRFRRGGMKRDSSN